VKNIIKILNSNPSLVYTLLHRFSLIFSSGLVTILLPVFLGPEEQGFYYVFGSIAASQVLFELGFGQIVLQNVAYYSTGLLVNKNQQIDGDADSLEKLSSVILQISKWYLYVSTLFFVASVVFGYFLFEKKYPENRWSLLFPYIVFIASVATNLYLASQISILEGLGQLGQVSLQKIVQSVVSCAVSFMVLYFGGGLWVVTVAPIVNLILSLRFIKNKNRVFLLLVKRRVNTTAALNWRKDVLPLQIKLGISWICGYFIHHVSTPIIMINLGAAEAGAYGITNTVVNSLHAIAFGCIHARLPKMVNFIALGDRRSLLELFRKSIGQALAVALFLIFGLIFVIWIGLAYKPKYFDRIAPFWVIFLLCVNLCASTAIASMAAFMRAHGEEPMLLPTIVGAALSLPIVWYGSQSSLLIMVVLSVSANVFFGLPWTFILFQRYWRLGETFKR
jgi:O-antigen/teichoic acid export membrane protein